MQPLNEALHIYLGCNRIQMFGFGSAHRVTSVSAHGAAETSSGEPSPHNLNHESSKLPIREQEITKTPGKEQLTGPGSVM